MPNRLTYAALLIITVVLGLTSRRFSALLPWWLAKNAGDVLYATMVFWLIKVVFPRLSIVRVAAASLLFCACIELLKFDDASWLVAARHSTAGALVFGRGFHASNLICYALGVLLAVGIESIIKRKQA